jgi:hypothetical protein
MINKTLDETVLELAQHTRDRCGLGFGQYPSGALMVLKGLQPFVNMNTRGTNGYGEPTKSIAEILNEIEQKLRER